MRSDYVPLKEYEHLLAALMPPNRLALELSLATGLRISDVLNIRTENLRKAAAAKSHILPVRELKTGKNRRVRVPVKLLDAMLAQAGKIYVWEGRFDYRSHRTRQAVYKDLKRAAALFRMPKKLQVSPHTARKVYAVSRYQSSGSLASVQKLLNHSSEAVTILYAMADQLTMRKLGPLVFQGIVDDV